MNSLFDSNPDENTFIFVMNSKQLKVPFHFENLVRINKNIFNSLIINHKYQVKTTINEDFVFQSFIEFIVYNKTPKISNDNIQDYIKLNQEFQFRPIEDLIQMEIFLKNSNGHFIDLNIIKEASESNKILLEEKVAENLDDYILYHGQELMNQPIETLIRIFTHPKRKMKKHNLACDLIFDHFELTKNSEIFSLLPTLDGDLIDEEELNDIIEKRKKYDNKIPKIDSLSLLSKIDEIKDKHQKIFRSLCFNKINSQKQFEMIQNELYAACNNEDVELIDWLTSEDIEHECGLSFKINQSA